MLKWLLGSLLITVASAFDVGLKCRLCQGITNELAKISDGGWSEKGTVWAVDALCSGIHAEGNCVGDSACRAFCASLGGEYTPLVLDLLKDDVGKDKVCQLLQLCPAVPLTEVSNEVRVASNPLAMQPLVPSRKGVVGYFVQLTDMHLDPLYQQGYEKDCGLPLCCRSDVGAVQLANWSDPRAADYWGSVGVSCDIPPRLSLALHRWFASQEDVPDFVLNSGDDPPHNIWEQNQGENAAAMSLVVEHHKVGFPKSPVLVSVGNHEFFPVDSARGTGTSTLNDGWLYGNAVDLWKTWLEPESLKTLGDGGYYSARLLDKFWLVSLSSTTLADDSMFHLDQTMGDWPDPFHQMAWLNRTLASIQQVPGAKVLLVAHHPLDDWNAYARTRFEAILTQFPTSFFTLMLNGHVHMNEFYVVSDAAGSLKMPGIVGGSLTTTGIATAKHGVKGCGVSGNPGFNVYRYNRSSLEILDVEYWWTDLNQQQPGVDPTWRKQYSARDVYQLANMSAHEWARVPGKLAQNATMERLYRTIWAKGGV